MRIEVDEFNSYHARRRAQGLKIIKPLDRYGLNLLKMLNKLIADDIPIPQVDEDNLLRDAKDVKWRLIFPYV